MCHDLLAADNESVRRQNARGLKPLEVLCECESFTSHSVVISSLIVKHLEVNSTATQWLSALKVLCSNTSVSEHSVQICKVILAKLQRGSFTVDVSQELLPLHYVCNSKLHNEWTGLRKKESGWELKGGENDRKAQTRVLSLLPTSSLAHTVYHHK
jgi:hypothetical protein